jgi:hypothetical protein
MEYHLDITLLVKQDVKLQTPRRGEPTLSGRKEGFFSVSKPRMLPFMATRRHLPKADELEDPRVHVLRRFSFQSRGFLIASTIRSAFVLWMVSSGSRLLVESRAFHDLRLPA